MIIDLKRSINLRWLFDPVLHSSQMILFDFNLTPFFRRVIFNVICSKMRVDYITRESLRNFYENFSGLEGDTLEKVATEGYRSMSAVSTFLIFLLCLHKASRTVTTNWTTRATSCFSQTSCSDEQSMDQVKMFYWQKLTKLNRPVQANTSSAALTIGTWTSRTRLSTICRSNPNKNGGNANNQSIMN